MALIICNGVINNLNASRTLWEPCKFFYTRVFHLEVESSLKILFTTEEDWNNTVEINLVSKQIQSGFGAFKIIYRQKPE